MSGKQNSKSEMFIQICLNALYVGVWIGLSGTVIIYNKWILAVFGFPYPITLTMWHMGFSSVLAFILVRTGVVPSANLSRETYMKAIVPIGGLFAITLWLSNAAYLYLSVSFIQMLKALMPVSVFAIGCIFGMESYNPKTLVNMIVVTIGVIIASYGEINFVVIGVLLQLASVATESTRLMLIQILLQRRGLSLNPITTMYYIAPASFLFLSVPFALLELRPVMNDPNVSFNPVIFLSNAGAAFALNMSVFMLIGKTSALTMNVAGVIKDWLLIGLSVVIFQAKVTSINLGGYLIAFGGVVFYNYTKLQAMQAKQREKEAQKDLESDPLVPQSPSKQSA